MAANMAAKFDKGIELCPIADSLLIAYYKI